MEGFKGKINKYINQIYHEYSERKSTFSQRSTVASALPENMLQVQYPGSHR